MRTTHHSPSLHAGHAAQGLKRNALCRQAAFALGLLLAVGVVTGHASDDKKWSLACRLYGDIKARRVGDIVTILIEEESEASRDAKSASTKKSAFTGSVNLGHPRIDSQPIPWTNAVIPTWTLDTSRQFDGSGSVENKDKFTTTISARVIEVLPNKNLLIEGKRSVVIQAETVTMILTGTVRPTDISRDNLVRSSVIADATIKYESNGPMTKNQKRGLLTALWNWINPF